MKTVSDAVLDLFEKYRREVGGALLTRPAYRRGFFEGASDALAGKPRGSKLGDGLAYGTGYVDGYQQASAQRGS